MPATYEQSTRIGELKPPAGLEGLVLRRFEASEGISELFEFRVVATHEDNANLNLGKALGKDATVTIRTYDKERFFVGTLAEARHIHTDFQGHGYLLVLRPWIHLMSKRVNSRVFANLTVPDIIKKLAGEYGRTINVKQQKTYPALEYVVQHAESDLNFILRLMEAHGISYHFSFSDGSYEMIATDSSRDDLSGGSERPYLEPGMDYAPMEEFVDSWFPQRHFTARKAKSNDYDFLKSSTKMVGETTASAEFDMQLEHYEQLYGQHLEKAASPSFATPFATILMDRLRTEDKRAVATGEAPGLTPGFNMKLTGHDNFSGSYTIVRCTHNFVIADYRSGGAQETNYDGTYEVIPKEQTFAPPLVTPRPRIAGVQTGKVVGTQDIDVDKHGRILVHMHWNTEGESKPEGQTMRCRVLQSWAGSDWGTIFTPRKGMEVLLQHIDGDPDRPVVIGCVYNDEHLPPYGLPGEKNISGWKSRSTEGGSASTYNEFVFDDTKGKELIRLHAQYDLDSTVEHDEKRAIKNDRTTTVTHNDTTTVDNDIMIEAKHQITLKVGQSTIVMDQSSITIKSGEITIQATGALKTEAGATADHKAGGPMTIKGAVVNIN